MKAHASMKAANRGVTLVEILVTVVIISVGLLGVAALHTISLRNGQYAHTRSQASAFAVDILDRMRANPVLAGSGAYDIVLTDSAPATPGTLAERDLKTWEDAIKAALPNGDGSIARATVGGRQLFTITIQWGEHQETTSFTTTAAL
jgi:type IV pilus assembly protein PilV